MLGAIVGDMVGSIYEAKPIKTKDFRLFGKGVTFTDDTICTVAIADSLLAGGDFAASLRAWVRRHPDRGYGAMFRRWALSDGMPAYGSWGNGSAMRVSPVAYAAPDLSNVIPNQVCSDISGIAKKRILLSRRRCRMSIYFPGLV